MRLPAITQKHFAGATTNAVVLNGQVVASETGNPLSGAIIKVSDGSTVQGATTGADGKFSISFTLETDVLWQRILSVMMTCGIS